MSRNTTEPHEICSKLTIKTPEKYHNFIPPEIISKPKTYLSSRAIKLFFVNFEQISHLYLVLPMLTLNQ